MLVSRTENFLSSLAPNKVSSNKDNEPNISGTRASSDIELSADSSKLSGAFDTLQGKFNSRSMSPNEMEKLAFHLESKGVISSSEAAVMAFQLDHSQISPEYEKLNRDKPIDQLGKWTDHLEFVKNRDMGVIGETSQKIVNILKSLA